MFGAWQNKLDEERIHNTLDPRDVDGAAIILLLGLMDASTPASSVALWDTQESAVVRGRHPLPQFLIWSALALAGALASPASQPRICTGGRGHSSAGLGINKRRVYAGNWA